MKVRIIAPFEIPGLSVDDWLEVPEEARVKDIFQFAKTIHPFQRLLPVSVNGKVVRKSYKLREKDIIIFMVPISGG